MALPVSSKVSLDNNCPMLNVHWVMFIAHKLFQNNLSFINSLIRTFELPTQQQVYYL